MLSMRFRTGMCMFKEIPVSSHNCWFLPSLSYQVRNTATPYVLMSYCNVDKDPDRDHKGKKNAAIKQVPWIPELEK